MDFPRDRTPPASLRKHRATDKIRHGPRFIAAVAIASGISPGSRMRKEGNSSLLEVCGRASLNSRGSFARGRATVESCTV